MMKKPSKNDLKLVFLWIFAFSVIIFMMTFTSHAETSPTNYPFNTHAQYIFDDNGTNKVINSLYFNFLSNDKETLIEHINNDLTTQNVPYTSYLVFISDISNRTTNLHGAQPHIQITYTILTNPTINTNIVQTDDFTSVICPITYTNSVNYRQTYTPSTSLNSYQYRASYNGGTFNALGTLTFINYNPFVENTYLGSGYYNANYPIIAYNIGDGILSLNNSLCIIDEPVPSFPIGVAVPPPTLFMPDFDGLTPPDKVPPSYTINNYTWNTYNPPTPDFSTLEDAVESLYDLIKYEWGYFRDNINGEFTTLQANIKGLFDYIGQTIQYYGGLIIDSINKGIETFYNNMKALLEPLVNDFNELKEDFVEFADLFIHPFDEEEFESQMESCELINLYEQLMDNCEVIQQIFDYAEERDYFVLYIDFENPFADSEHKIIHSEISFNWLVPLRSVYRPFLWTFTLFECFVGGMRILGNIIGGKAK